MRTVKEIETEVLTRPGPLQAGTNNLQVKEVLVGEGERRGPYSIGVDPSSAADHR
jgi:hypothetical protein